MLSEIVSRRTTPVTKWILKERKFDQVSAALHNVVRFLRARERVQMRFLQHDLGPHDNICSSQAVSTFIHPEEEQSSRHVHDLTALCVILCQL